MSKGPFAGLCYVTGLLCTTESNVVRVTLSDTSTNDLRVECDLTSGVLSHSESMPEPNDDGISSTSHERDQQSSESEEISAGRSTSPLRYHERNWSVPKLPLR